jgi:hypothetical protein
MSRRFTPVLPLALTMLALLAACTEPPTGPAPAAPEAKAGPASTAAQLAAASAAAAAMPKAEGPPSAAAPAPADTGSTAATRRARYDARRAAALPPGLNASWKRALGAAPGKITSVAHTWHTAWEKAVAYDDVSFEIRFFGEDAQNDAAMVALLRAAKLPGAPDALPEGEQQHGDVTWQVERHALIAPAGEAREIRYEVRVTRDAVPPTIQPGCRKPRTLEVPAGTPGWLKPLVSAGSTRRLVALRDRRGEEGRDDALRFHMLFHNGEAADEFIGRLTDAATAGGLRRESGGEGNRQTWKGQGGERLTFKPTTEDLRLGCRVEGPVTVVEWTTPAPNQ